jgi:hypothetical protein
MVSGNGGEGVIVDKQEQQQRPPPAQILGYWGQWFTQCSWQSCDAAGQDYLLEYARRHAYAKLQHGGGQHSLPPAPSKLLEHELKHRSFAMELLEAQVFLDTAEGRKATKSWLKDKMCQDTSQAQATCEKYLSTIIRTALVRLARKETPAARPPQGLNEEGQHDGIETLPDHAPGPAERLAQSDIMIQARRTAREFATTLSDNECLLVAASGLKIKLNDARLLLQLGKKKTASYEMMERIQEKLNAFVSQKFPRDAAIISDLQAECGLQLGLYLVDRAQTPSCPEFSFFQFANSPAVESPHGA